MDVVTVWNSINGRLTNFILGKVNDIELAKDIVQDVFLKVFTQVDTLKNNDKMVSWIYQIARNEVISHFRKSSSNDLEKNINLSEVATATLTAEVAECLHPLIESLPEKYREALVWADIEKIPQKEIANRLNISYSGAKSRVQRGREMLKSIMEECCSITTDVYGDIIDYELKPYGKAKLGDCQNDC
jgi:RNA polymerase sigma-70 factor (ECF subfamily)